MMKDDHEDCVRNSSEKEVFCMTLPKVVLKSREASKQLMKSSFQVL